MPVKRMVTNAAMIRAQNRNPVFGGAARDDGTLESGVIRNNPLQKTFDFLDIIMIFLRGIVKII
jgi:hypothetical protein